MGKILHNIKRQTIRNNSFLSVIDKSRDQIINGIFSNVSLVSGSGIVGTPIPPPPYAVFSLNGTIIMPSISTPSYSEGSGPGASSTNFSLIGAGLVPAAGNITITPSTDIEVFNPNNSTWNSVAFTVAYTGSVINQSGFAVRLKTGLTVGSYNENVVVTALNTTPFNTLVTSSVTAVSVFMQASGGNITTDGNFKVHTFLTGGSFQVTQLSTSSSFNIVQYLIQAGGGAGGAQGNYGGGGGGGGQLLGSGMSVSLAAYPISVGFGGIAGGPSSDGGNGFNSTFNSLVALGGGGGGALTGINGGSGGGAGGTSAGGLGTSGQGFNGGDANANNGAGGGGGAGGVGQNALGSGIGGNGGNGVQSAIAGILTYYGGGGGGGGAVPYAIGGLGGGGTGGDGIVTPTAGQVNSGSGGGGGTGSPAGSGGSGIVIIRYRFQ